LPSVRAAHFQQFQISNDNGQQIFEIMCNATRHLTNGIQSLRTGKRVFGRFAVGQIMLDSDEDVLATDL
jgi:hypothetical protein